MNHTAARCGCPVPAVGAPGSAARRAVESRACDKPRCRSGLPAKFTDGECEAYCALWDYRRVRFLVDLKTKGVTAYWRRRVRTYPDLIAALAAWREGG